MRSCKTVFQSIGTVPATNEWKFLLRHIFPSVGVISVFYFSPFNKCAEVPHYFNLHLPKYMMLSVLHMLICHLCIIFSKMSIHIFCPFFNWVVCFLFLNFKSSWNPKPQWDGIWRRGLQELIRSDHLAQCFTRGEVTVWISDVLILWWSYCNYSIHYMMAETTVSNRFIFGRHLLRQ